MSADPIERRRAARQRQTLVRAAVLAGVVLAVGATVGVTVAVVRGRQRTEEVAKRAEPPAPVKDEPAAKPAAAVTAPPASEQPAPTPVPGFGPDRIPTTDFKGKQMTVEGILDGHSMHIDDAINANGGGDGKYELLLLLKRPGEADVHCYFPRDDTSTSQRILRYNRPVVVISGVFDRAPTSRLIVLQNCRLVSIGRETAPARP